MYNENQYLNKEVKDEFLLIINKKSKFKVFFTILLYRFIVFLCTELMLWFLFFVWQIILYIPFFYIGLLEFTAFYYFIILITNFIQWELYLKKSCNEIIEESLIYKLYLEVYTELKKEKNRLK